MSEIVIMGMSLINGNRTFKKFRKYEHLNSMDELEKLRKEKESENPGCQVAFVYREPKT
jgi:hypothetical protein